MFGWLAGWLIGGVGEWVASNFGSSHFGSSDFGSGRFNPLRRPPMPERFLHWTLGPSQPPVCVLRVMALLRARLSHAPLASCRAQRDAALLGKAWRLQRGRRIACISLSPQTACQPTSLRISGRSRPLSAKRSSQRGILACRGSAAALVGGAVRWRTTSPRRSGPTRAPCLSTRFRSTRAGSHTSARTAERSNGMT